jgi:clan AA aspartic protease (TIGR02281 family)
MHGHLYLRSFSVALCIVACTYASVAGDADDGLRQEFEKYFYGRGVPENHGRAKQSLEEAAQSGEEWAILLIAQDQEKSTPQEALDAYLQLARNDNCVAQARLAYAYSSSTLVKKNITQAYFWLLLARVQRSFTVKSNVNYSSSSRGVGYISGDPITCLEANSVSMSTLQSIIETQLPAKLMQVAKDAATNWTKGTVEKLLPAPATIEAASHAGEVVLKQDGGIFVVPVGINGTMTLDFAVDSGASDVSIPADVFSTLLRTGTVKASDIIGEQTLEMADGSQSTLPTFTIRSLKVGDKVIENVKATVAPSKGTLLLGQSFLGRFKSWSLDNANHVLVLNPQ